MKKSSRLLDGAEIGLIDGARLAVDPLRFHGVIIIFAFNLFDFEISHVCLMVLGATKSWLILMFFILSRCLGLANSETAARCKARDVGRGMREVTFLTKYRFISCPCYSAKISDYSNRTGLNFHLQFRILNKTQNRRSPCSKKVTSEL